MSRVPVESFLYSVPSWPQAPARFYGTIQAVSPTQSYVIDSKVRSVSMAILYGTNVPIHPSLDESVVVWDGPPVKVRSTKI